MCINVQIDIVFLYSWEIFSRYMLLVKWWRLSVIPVTTTTTSQRLRPTSRQPYSRSQWEQVHTHTHTHTSPTYCPLTPPPHTVHILWFACWLSNRYRQESSYTPGNGFAFQVVGLCTKYWMFVQSKLTDVWPTTWDANAHSSWQPTCKSQHCLHIPPPHTAPTHTSPHTAPSYCHYTYRPLIQLVSPPSRSSSTTVLYTTRSRVS